MNIKTIIVISSSFLISSPIFAATQYGNITIDENTTAAQYVVDFFNLALALGALAAVAMLIMAGIEWITSSGNPSKIESAKGKIKNTLFGVAVLIGCYFILSTVNDNLTTVKIDDLYCDHGIVAMVQPPKGKPIKKCIDTSLSDIEKSVGGTISSTTWKFPKDYLWKAYFYSETDYKGTMTEASCSDGICNGSLSGVKSIYFIMNNKGIYLYDDNNFVPKVKFPLFASVNIPDLSSSSMQFDNFTKSIEINESRVEDKLLHFAIAFRDPNYQGRCALINQSVQDMDSAPASTNMYNGTVGSDGLSSIIVSTINLNEDVINKKRGEIILYSKTNCGKSDDSDAAAEIKSCHIPVDDGGLIVANIQEKCSDWSVGGADTVQSFEITGDIGIVLSTSERQNTTDGTYCMYFDKKDLKEGTCKDSLLGTHIYTIGGVSPKSIIIMPKN